MRFIVKYTVTVRNHKGAHMKKKLLLITMVLTLALSTYAFAITTEVSNVESIISQLEEMRTSENAVSKTLLSEMASGLLELESAIRTSGASATEEVYDLLDKAEATLVGVPTSYEEVGEVQKAISKVRTSLGVSEYIEEENNKAAALTDLDQGGKPHWGKAYIEKLINIGGISGYPDGTFRPNNNITRAEFVTIAVRSALDGNVSKAEGSHWANGVFESARENQVLLPNDFPMSEWNEPITRYEMAYVMVRVSENILNEGKTDTTGVARIMSDYQEVKEQLKYKYYVEQAFMKGLVTGKTADGQYDGSANGTRAEAATMVVRMLDQTIRKEVNTNEQVEASAEAKQVLESMPTYNEKTDHGLIFGGKGYTLDDVAVFAQSYLLVRTNYDGTSKAAMDQWEKDINQYLTTGGPPITQELAKSILDDKEKAESDVYVDASKIEIKEGRFFVNAVVFDKTTNKTWKVQLRIGGHDINKSELAMGIESWTEVK